MMKHLFAGALALALLATVPARGQTIDALGSAAGMNDTDVFPVCQPTCTVAAPALKMTGALTAAYVFAKVHGDFTITSTGTVSLGSGIIYSRIQNVAPSSLLGNPTGSAASMSEITLVAPLAFSGTTLRLTANGITNAFLAAAGAQNTLKGAATSTAETDLAAPSCSTANSGLTWTTNTGLGCNTALASLSTADQTVTGGANVTSLSLTTGSVTIDCGARPSQFITNGGAFTITAPTNDGSCMVLVTNGASAGAITFSGFTVGAAIGDPLTTTNTSKFTLSIWRVNGTAGYRVAAHQ